MNARSIKNHIIEHEILGVEAGAGGSVAGSTGYVQFNTGGAFDAEAELFWDKANNRLGIGTAAPAVNLHVYQAATGTIATFETDSLGTGIRIDSSELGPTPTEGIINFSADGTTYARLIGGKNFGAAGGAITFEVNGFTVLQAYSDASVTEVNFGGNRIYGLPDPISNQDPVTRIYAENTYVPLTRVITSGNGLTGGGALSANLTLNVGAGTGITVNANDVAINQAFTPTWTGAHIFANATTALQIGNGAAGVDYRILFDGETNNGTITWMEDEAYFSLSHGLQFSDAASLDVIRIGAVGAESALWSFDGGTFKSTLEFYDDFILRTQAGSLGSIDIEPAAGGGVNLGLLNSCTTIMFKFNAGNQSTAAGDAGLMFGTIQHAAPGAGGTYLNFLDGPGGASIGSITSNGTTSKITVGQIQVDEVVNGTGLAAGVYSPSDTANSNLDSATATEAQYLRVGNTVTVSGRFTADATAGGAASFELSLPVASNIGAVEDLAGMAYSRTAGETAEITGSVANDTAVVAWTAVSTASQTWSYSFTYQVI